MDLREYGLDLEQVGGYFYPAYEDETRPGEWVETPTTQHGTTFLAISSPTVQNVL